MNACDLYLLATVNDAVMDVQIFKALLSVLLRVRVEGPCLHRPGNWLVRQLSDESKPVYKVGFIRERKGCS
jgi:hypothetical protein